MKLSVVIPCYNEAPNLPALVAGYAVVAARTDLELILVDNGSTDDTPAALAALLKEPRYSFARSLRVERNVGYGHGIRAGLAECRGEASAFSHADMQCRPEDVLRGFELYGKSGPGTVLVKGRRTNREGLERFLSAGYSGLACAALGIPAADVNGQPKIFPRSLAALLAGGPDDFALDLYVLYRAARAGLRVVEFDVAFEPRLHGESKWAFNARAKLRGILRFFRQIVRIRLGGYG